MFTSPFSKLTHTSEKKLTITLIITTIVSIFCMLFFDSFLINDICKNGITSFELAKDIEQSKAILNSWDVSAKINASLSMGYDFLFLILYSSLIALLIHKLNEQLWKNTSFYIFGIILIYAQFIAAFFDSIENIGLIQLLLGNLQQIWASIAYYFAIPKFIIIILGILYILSNFIYLQLKKLTHA